MNNTAKLPHRGKGYISPGRQQITIPIHPAIKLSSNGSEGTYRTHIDPKAALRETGRTLALNAINSGKFYRYCEMTDVKALIRIPQRKMQFDAPNMYPSIKPIIDGMVNARVWPDDNYRWIRDLTFRYDPRPTRKGYEITLIITPTGRKWIDTLAELGLQPTQGDIKSMSPYGLDRT